MGGASRGMSKREVGTRNVFLYSSMKERPCLQFALMHWWLPWGTIHNSCGLLLPMLGCPVCD